MERILVVGATGQLGAGVVRRLARRDVAVRAMTRTAASASRFQGSGVEPVLGDLTDPGSLARACEGVSTIVATANAAIPTQGRDTFEAVERDGYRSLVRSALSAGVRRIVYTSVVMSETGERLTPFFRYKRETEQLLMRSGMEYVIFRAGVFMDVAFTMMGSTIPLQGSECATVLRPFGFANRYFARIKDSIEQKHVALIPGDGTTRHTFICVDDVAEFHVAAAFAGAGVYDLGGPEALTYLDVVRIYERLLGVPLRVKKTPAAVFRVAAPLIRAFSPAGANLMCMNYLAATEDMVAEPWPAQEFGVSLTSAEAFLQGRRRMAAAAV